MILAETYPAERTRIGTEVFEDARARGVRLYVEYPAEIPDLEVGPSRTHRKGIYDGKHRSRGPSPPRSSASP